MPSKTKRERERERERERGRKNHGVEMTDTTFIIITGEIRIVYGTEWFQAVPTRPSRNYRLETRNHGEVKKVA